MNSSPHSANARRHSPSGESTFGRAKRRVSLFFLVLSLDAWSGNVYAQTSFYQGKTIRVIVGSSAGGGYDLWARLTGLYLGKYIPGKSHDRGSKHARCGWRGGCDLRL